MSDDKYKVLLKLILDNVNSGVAVINKEGKFETYNKQFLHLFGLSEDSSINNVNDQNWSDWKVFNESGEILHVDEHPVRKVALTGKKVENQLVGVLVPAEQDKKWMLISAEPVKIEDIIVNIVCTYTEITDHIKKEAKIRENEKKLSQIYNSMIEGLAIHQLVYDSKGDITDYYILDINKAFEKITGFKKEDCIGRKAREIYNTKDAPYIDIYSKVVLTGNGENFEVFFQPMDKYFKISAFSLENGRFGTIFEDISERKKWENEILISRERLNAALELGQIGLWEWDLEKNILSGDDNIKKILNLHSNDYEIDFKKAVSYVVDEDLSYLNTLIYAGNINNSSIQSIIRVKVNNEIKHLSIKGFIHKDDIGNPKKISAVCFDITEMAKGTERRLIELNEELMRSNKELQQFAYVTSHDLQEPLRMITSYTQLLMRRLNDLLDSDTKEFMHFIIDGAGRMQNLIQDLLAYSRINTRGNIKEKLSVNDILINVKLNLHHYIEERKATITINNNIPFINADKLQITQLFQNLIVNGIKFNKNEPEINIIGIEENEEYKFCIEDNGIGIEQQYFDRIFLIFQRLHLRDEYPGTGIGLALCKRIIEKHGGRIWLDSQKDKGTKFYFTIRK